MKLLFLGFHYLGPLYPLALWLAEKGHEVLYASNRSSNLHKPFSGAFQRVILKRFSLPVKNDTPLDVLENGLTTARNAEKSFLVIKESGFEPEIVFSASSGGAALAIPAVFPHARWLNFVEPSFRGQYREQLIQNLQLSLASETYTFYPSQKRLFPKFLRERIREFIPVVNTRWYTPGPKRAVDNLAVFFNLREPERILTEFLKASPQNRAIWLIENGPAKKLFAAAANDFPEERCHVRVAPDPEERRKIFQGAKLSFFEFPGELALQAMACGSPCFAAEKIDKEDLPTGALQVPPSGKVQADLLKNPVLLEDYGKKCRQIVINHHDADSLLPAWFTKVCEQVDQRDKL